MGVRVGDRTGDFEAISFDGGGAALHLGGRHFALNREDMSITTPSPFSLRIETGNKVINVSHVEPACLNWLALNRYIASHD